MADLTEQVFDRVKCERFGGISATAIYHELRAPVGKVYEVEPAEYAVVKPPEAFRPTVVSKIRGIGKTGQKSLF